VLRETRGHGSARNERPGDGGKEGLRGAENAGEEGLDAREDEGRGGGGKGKQNRGAQRKRGGSRTGWEKKG